MTPTDGHPCLNSSRMPVAILTVLPAHLLGRLTLRMSETVSEVAYEARNLARQAGRDITKHEEICAERYAEIRASVKEVKGWITWGGSFALTIVIGLLAFLASAQFKANDEDRRLQQARIDQLEHQLTVSSRDHP